MIIAVMMFLMADTAAGYDESSASATVPASLRKLSLQWIILIEQMEGGCVQMHDLHPSTCVI